MYKVNNKRPRRFDYDLIVIGSGSGGGVAAHLSAKQGKRVAIIEDTAMGGECPNFGCIPTKALLKTAETYRTAKGANKFGVRATNVSVNYKNIKAWKDAAVHRTGTYQGKEVFNDAGVDVIRGHGHFLNKWTVSTGKKRYQAKKFVVATGTYSFCPNIEGLKETGYITYREAIDLDSAPKSLFVIGGGPIGCEFAFLFGSFGTKVHIAEISDNLIPQEDKEMGQTVEHIFAEADINVLSKTKVIKVSGRAGRKEVTYEQAGVQKRAIVEEVLLAAGKRPLTDLGLENAGVAFDAHGIKVKSTMATTNPNIYACGDVTGKYNFTHVASYQSRIAANNMWHRKKMRADYHAIPRVVFVDPEAAAVGATERELADRKIQYQKASVPISILGRSNTSGNDVGFVKVLASHTGVLLGASVVCPHAGEVIGELTLAIQNGLKASDVEKTVHAFPTWNEAVRTACTRIISI